MRFLLIFMFTCLVFACNDKDSAPDVSHLKSELPLKRFEQDFFKLDTSALAAGFEKLNRQYPRFFPLFTSGILRIPIRMEGNQLDPQVELVYRQILSSYRPVFDSISMKYRSMEDVKEELEQSFAFVKYYFPDFALPELITFIGTFDAPGIILTPGHLGIGLHQFAGKNFSIYQDPQLLEVYPVYISRRFDEEYIPVAAMKAVADDIHRDSSEGRPLIEQMIEKGKQWFLTDHFLPHTHDSLITGFTAKQLEWTENNEGNIWTYINANSDIYTIDETTIQEYIGEGPFTRGMPEGFAPGNLGQWVGWQIVRKFSEDNSEMSLQQVLKTPAITIFQQSKYRPK